MSGYGDMTREQLEQRLLLAENVCVMVGWTGMDYASQRGKAAFQLWKRWANEPGVDTSPKAHRDLADLEDELAAESAHAIETVSATPSR